MSNCSFFFIEIYFLLRDTSDSLFSFDIDKRNNFLGFYQGDTKIYIYEQSTEKPSIRNCSAGI